MFRLQRGERRPLRSYVHPNAQVKVLHLCNGNFFRSAFGIAYARLHYPEFEHVSAGARQEQYGLPCYPIVVDAAREHGYDLSEHRTSMLRPELLEGVDLVLAAEAWHESELRGRGYEGPVAISNEPDVSLNGLPRPEQIAILRRSFVRIGAFVDQHLLRLVV